MNEKNINAFAQMKALGSNHPLASSTFVSSPCGTFKVKCKIKSLSFAGYEFAILYHRPDLGDRYMIGQEITIYHESEKWSRLVSVVSRQGNLIRSLILNPATTITFIADDGKKTTHICEFLGQYSDLYRVSFSHSELLNGNMILQLPTGENFPVKLRWKKDDEICFQLVQISHALVGGKSRTAHL